MDHSPPPSQDIQLQEALLAAWIDLSAVLRNDRIMSEHLSYNEAVLCGLLEKQRAACPEAPWLPIRELCAQTRMLKSQVNKIIMDMEERGLALRRRLAGDRRLVFVELTEKGRETYKLEHARVLAIVQRVIANIGEREALAATELLNTLCSTVVNIIDQGE